MDEFQWDWLGRTDLLPTDKQLNKPSLLFSKIEDDVIAFQQQKLADTIKANAAIEREQNGTRSGSAEHEQGRDGSLNEAANYQAEPIKETISFDDFQKLDIRVGTVLECERVPKMKKLLKFRIADGSSPSTGAGVGCRTIVSGISQWYEPEQLVGRQVLFVANLAPREFKNGLVSEGMILSAENYDGTISVTTTEHEVKPGSKIS